MSPRGRIERIFAVVGATTILVVGFDSLTYAATGSSLLLGRLNKAGAVTTVQNTGNGAALALVTRNASYPPFTTNAKGLVPNLFAARAATADRVGGLTVAQIKAAAKGDPGIQGPPGVPGISYGNLSTPVDVSNSNYHNVADVTVTAGVSYVVQWSVESVVAGPSTVYCELGNYLEGSATFETLPHGPRQVSTPGGDQALSGSWAGTTPLTGHIYLVCTSPAASASITSANLISIQVG
jgi:hypothetical protein